MAKKKTKKKASEKPRPRRKKAAAKRAPPRRTKARRARKTAARKAAVKKAPARKKTVRKTKRAWASPRQRGRAGSSLDTILDERGLGPETGGQSGDTEGLSRAELADSESVEELLEEGQAFEAGVISGVENAPDADSGEIQTREVPEDDVPREYLDED